MSVNKNNNNPFQKDSEEIKKYNPIKAETNIKINKKNPQQENMSFLNNSITDEEERKKEKKKKKIL